MNSTLMLVVFFINFTYQPFLYPALGMRLINVGNTAINLSDPENYGFDTNKLITFSVIFYMLHTYHSFLRGDGVYSSTDCQLYVN